MKETQKRIMEYSFKLPKLKEKVIAVALLLAVSASMLVTVSFAWLSISINPAVQGVNTTIAANGNLEIALATGSASTITAPGESNVGDSNLAILERNLTWGNLVNLADASYGLSQMTLRPAKLNDDELATNPLHGPVYDESGRLVMLDTSFGYSSWNSELSTFEITDNLGVRAITSMIEGEAGEASVYRNELAGIVSDNGILQGRYTKLAGDSVYMNVLTEIMVGYMLHTFKTTDEDWGWLASEASFDRKQLQNFKALYEDFAKVLEEEAQVYAKFLNLQSKVEKKSVTITAEEILALSAGTAATTLKNMGYAATEKGFINNIDTFLSDYNIVKEDIVNIQGIIDAMPNSGSVSWPNAKYTNSDNVTVSLEDIVNRFAVLATCDAYLPNANKSYEISSFAYAGNVAAIASEKSIIITIDNGLLYNFENRTGASLKAEGIPLQMSAAGQSINVEATVQTNATDNYFNTERQNLNATIAAEYGTPRLVPNEAYGLAIDFWVRTNASGGYLTLQGNVLTTKEEVEVTGIDRNGNTVNIYSLSREITQEVEGENGETTSETYTQSYDLYWLEKEVDGKTQKVWYNAFTHEIFELKDGEAPKQKIETVETVIGYEGDNRVWEGDEHAILSVNSTTQGSGSCYVYYASTPEDQARSLELLKYMKVAFIDAEGNLLAEAYMDTERHYAANGKVTVPMVLENNSDSINLGTDEDGNPIIAITALEKNTPMLVTAIVYLDGDNLTNQHVLASSDIDGQLNIQFGNNQLLKPIENEELYYSEMKVTASVTNTEFSYDDNTEMKTTVEVVVDGVEPNTVEAFFIRAINSQTGAKEKSFTLNDDDGDGVWTADYEFLYPGTYILRSVTIDGIERELTVAEGSSFPTVTVKGFEINNVNYNINPTVLSVNNSYTGDVSLQFATNDPERMPKTVTGKFIREDGTTVNVNFAYNSTTQLWSGNATFVSSGEYTMQYVVLDGEYTELDEGNRFTTNVKLGVKVHVSTNTKTNFVKDDVKDDYPKTLDMMVYILDNANNRVTNVTDASLTYSLRGSPATMYTTLTWNAEKQCFEGSFKTQTGIWSFSHVDITYGDAVNTLSKANGDAPVFTILAPDPPENVSGKEEGTPYQYVSGIKTDDDLYEMVTESGATKVTVKGASASVVLKYATAAQVYAKLVPASTNQNKNPVYVLGASSGDSMEEQTTIFTFAIPEGEWKLVSVSAFDVFDADQIHHPWEADWNVDGKLPAMISEQVFEEGMEIDVADTTVAALYNVTVTVKHPNNGNKDVITLGKNDSGNISASFMQAQTLSGDDIIVTFYDANGLLTKIDEASGEPYFTITNVKLPYGFAKITDDEIKGYGGYITSAIDKGNTHCTALFTGAVDQNGNVERTKFVLSSDLTFAYATKYDPGQLSYSIKPKGGSESGTVYADTEALSVAVWTKAPAVTVAGVGNTSQINTTIKWSNGWLGALSYTLGGKKTNSLDTVNNTVTVYAEAVTKNLGSDATFNLPSVTFAASGFDDDSVVTLTIPEGTGGASAVTTTINGNNTSAEVTLGKLNLNIKTSKGTLSGTTYAVDGYIGHGENVRITTVTVVRNNVTFTVYIEKPIIINNPSSTPTS